MLLVLCAFISLDFENSLGCTQLHMTAAAWEVQETLANASSLRFPRHVPQEGLLTALGLAGPRPDPGKCREGARESVEALLDAVRGGGQGCKGQNSSTQ